MFMFKFKFKYVIYNKFNMFITAVCVLFLIKLRWPRNKSIYDTVSDLTKIRQIAIFPEIAIFANMAGHHVWN